MSAKSDDPLRSEIRAALEALGPEAGGVAADHGLAAGIARKVYLVCEATAKPLIAERDEWAVAAGKSQKALGRALRILEAAGADPEGGESVGASQIMRWFDERAKEVDALKAEVETLAERLEAALDACSDANEAHDDEHSERQILQAEIAELRAAGGGDLSPGSKRDPHEATS